MKRTLIGLSLALAASALPASHAVADQPVPTLVGSWHLEEPEGVRTAPDSSPFGNNGNVSADVLQGVSGFVGFAFEFTGFNPIVRVPNPSGSLNPGASPLVISAYLNVPSDLVSGDYNVIQKGPATAPGGAYKLEVFAPASTSNRYFGFPACAVNTPATTTNQAKQKNRAYGPVRIDDSAWHHVTCHLTATDLYVTVDGREGAHVARTVGSISNTYDLTVGGKPNNTHYFRGVLDEVTITIG